VRDQFLVEVGTGESVPGLAEMNRLFQIGLFCIGRPSSAKRQH
jgi:hypothetical protein